MDYWWFGGMQLGGRVANSRNKVVEEEPSESNCC